ncbi:MAG: hypothetical protein B6I31_00730 [Desulfobacteraceae bacterium 4572_19]|nr:MAG: hypothetical protein B6I31_00730 [Desulfobacteraceae bacterium 4572_19]
MIEEMLDAEYEPYLISGTGGITGQAFLTHQESGVVKAAGRTVTLDPATTLGSEWWNKSGKFWDTVTPPSPTFHKARKSTITDVEGRFSFNNLAAGEYFIRTMVTWIMNDDDMRGGVIGKLVEVRDGEVTEVILNKSPK